MAVLDLGKVVPEKGVDYFTESDVNQIVDDVVDEITIPTKVSELENDSEFIDKTANNLTYYTLATNTGSTIELSINSSTYVMTINLKNAAGTVISTGSVDLPLESVVVNGSYDSTNKKIVLTLQSGSTIDVPVGDLVSGLQSEITTTNKLSSDLVDDTNGTNKFVTASDKTTWGNKYDKPSGGIPSTDLSSAVQTSLGKADTAIQDVSDKQDTLVSGTNIKTINNQSILGSGNVNISGGQTIQYDTIPTASSSNVGDIIQYVGTTTSDYVKGYYYRCVSDGMAIPSYSWERNDTQPSKYLLDGNNLTYFIKSGQYGIETNSLTSQVNVSLPTAELIEAIELAQHYNKKLNLLIIDTSGGNTLMFTSQTIPPTTNTTLELTSKTTSQDGNVWITKLMIAYSYASNHLAITSCKRVGTSLLSIGIRNSQTYDPIGDSYNPATAKYAESMTQCVAPAYNKTSSYAVGDYVTRYGALYICNTAIPSGENWNASHWTQTNVATILGNLETALSNITTGNGV